MEESESEVAQSSLTLCDPMDCSPPGSSILDSPGKNTGVRCHFLLQGIFPTHGLNPGLPHCGRTLYRLSHQGFLAFLNEWMESIQKVLLKLIIWISTNKTRVSWYIFSNCGNLLVLDLQSPCPFVACHLSVHLLGFHWTCYEGSYAGP